MKEKKVAAFVSVVSNSSLIALKLFVGFITGSVSVVSEALHSFCDLIASFIALFSVSRSSEPADEEHPFGHGKFEDLAGFVEAILIIVTALYICYIAVEKLVGAKYEQIETLPGILVMAFSVLLNGIVSWYLYKVAKKTDSIALYTDAQHLSADIYSSLAIFVGLILVKITGLHILDPILALVVGFIVLMTGVKLTKFSANNLLDGSLPHADRSVIEETVKGFDGRGLCEIKSIKTSKSGAKKIVQMVLYLDASMSLSDAHSLCDDIELEVASRLQNAQCFIHPEPRE